VIKIGKYTLDFTDILGIIGSFLIVGAYFGQTEALIDPKSLLFHFINGLGSFLLLVSLYFKPNIGAIVIEGLWLMVAIWGMCKAIF